MTMWKVWQALLLVLLMPAVAGAAEFTVADNYAPLRYSAAASQTTFTVSWPFESETDLVVKVKPSASSTFATKTLTTDYTVTGESTSAGGTVVFGTALSSGDVVVITRDMPIARTTDFGAGVTSSALNLNLDRAAMERQQNESDIQTRALLAPDTWDFTTYNDLTFDNAPSSGQGLCWSSAEDGSIVNCDLSTGTTPTVVEGGSWTTQQTPIQIRRGSTATREAVTPDDGEIGWDSTQGRLWIGDGTNAGGLPIGLDVYNVKTFGAKADWVSAASPGTDDSAAIQAAITACGDSAGGVVYLPSGGYRVDTGLLIDATGGAPAFNCVILGDGEAGSFGHAGATTLYTDKAIVVLKYDGDNQEAPRFENLVIKDYGENMLIGAASGSGLTAGETITGGTSGATGVVNANTTGTVVYFTPTAGTFQSGEVITGGTSTETATTATVPAVGGIMTGGIEIENGDGGEIRNVGIVGARTGFGVYFNGSSDFTQYHTIYRPFFVNNKYAIKTTGDVTDVMLIGGHLLGRNPDVTPLAAPPSDTANSLIDNSIGIWMDGTGRFQIFGTAINSFETQIWNDGGRDWTLSGVAMEGHPAAATWSTGLSIGVGDGSSLYGSGTTMTGGTIIRQSVGILIESGAVRTKIFGVDFSANTTNISDSSGQYSHFSAEGTSPEGFAMGYQDSVGGVSRQFRIKPRKNTSQDEIIEVRVTPDTGLNVSDGDYAGGLYAGADSAAEGMIGAGIYGDPAEPKTSGTDAAFLRFTDDEVHLGSRTSSSDGTDIGVAARSRLRVTGQADNAQYLEVSTKNNLATVTSGSDVGSVTIPAGALLLGVTATVKATVSLTTATGFMVGDGTTNDLWGETTTLTAGETLGVADYDATFTGPIFYPSATVIHLKPSDGAGNVTGTFDSATTGTIRVVIHYLLLSPATS